MRKIAVAAAVVLAVLGAALVLLPFNRPTSARVSYVAGVETHCPSPVVGAWRTEHDSGWFGYSPLTSTPLSVPTCQGAARHRLAWGSASLAAAALIGLGLRRRGRDENLATPPAVA